MAKKMGGVAGIWLDEHTIVEAARKVKAMGSDKVEALSPYPVHGMEDALQIKRSPIPYVTFVAALVGLSTGLFICWWTSVVNWPINVGGKPFFSLPAFIPIMFELTILFAALSSVASLFYFCRLPQIDPPVIDPDLTSHKFALFIPENDVVYDEQKLSQAMRDLGAVEIKKVTEF